MPTMMKGIPMIPKLPSYFVANIVQTMANPPQNRLKGHEKCVVFAEYFRFIGLSAPDYLFSEHQLVLDYVFCFVGHSVIPSSLIQYNYVLFYYYCMNKSTESSADLFHMISCFVS